MKRFTMLQTVAGMFLCTSLATLAQSAATPTFTPNGADFTSSRLVQITSATAGSTIYYTTDGSTPTGSSPSIASGSSITLTSSAIVKAIAKKSPLDDSAVATSGGYYHYSVASNQHYFYGNWPDPLFDNKMTVLKSGPPYNSGVQHFNFFTNTVIETKGALAGFKVLSDWKFHGNGATLKLSKNIPMDSTTIPDYPGQISAYVFGAHSASSSGLVNSVLIEGFDINCNYDDLSQKTGLLKLRGIQLIGTQNEVRNCTVRQPIGWFGAINDLSEVFAIDLRTEHSNSWNNVISNCVVMDYEGGANTWVNGIAMSSADGVTLSGTVQNCKVYGNGNGNDYGYNAQGPVSVIFDGNESYDMNRGFNNDAGDGSNIEWNNSVFHVPANASGMYILASHDGLATFNTFYLNGMNSAGIALGGPDGVQLGARDWVFDANWIERTGEDTGCRGVVFGPFPWQPIGTTAPSDITLTYNFIDLCITNLVANGTNTIFLDNTGLEGTGTPQGFVD